jgi:alcohol dehydrogenase
MKAAVLERFGAPLVLRDCPPPELGTGEVLVEVVAAPVLP